MLKIILRRLLRNKVYSGINIVGLATGLACFLLITTYVLFEYGYDSFHDKGDRIFRLTSQGASSGEVYEFAMTPTAAYPVIKREMPEVEAGVRIYNTADFSPTVVRLGDEMHEEKQFLWADSSFFDIFSFKILRGDARTLLDEVNTIVLSESTARRYFGEEDPVGKSLKVSGVTADLKITGVAADAPENSQIKYDFVASFHSLENWRDLIWDSANFLTYLQLNDAAAAAQLEDKIKSGLPKWAGESFTESNYLTYRLQPLREVHLKARVEGGLEPGSDIRYVYVFLAIGLLILLIACINYINLTTARSVERARETGIRKVAGAYKTQLFTHFLAESTFVTGIALLFGFIGAYLLLPVFNQLTGRELTFEFWQQPVAILGLLGLGIIVSLISGGYPALILSGFQPARVLKGDFKTTGSGGSLRRGLVIFQFAVSFLLIVGTLVITRQLNYIQNRKLGYDKEHIVALPIDGKMRGNLAMFKNEFKSDPNVVSVTMASETPVFVQGGYSIWTEGNADDVSMGIGAIGADYEFVKTLGMKLVAGTDFTASDVALVALDSAELRQYHFILNATAVKDIGWTPESAIGKRARINGREGLVKAVVEDFHFASLHQNIGPIAFFITDREASKLILKLSGKDLNSTIGILGEKWKKLVPHRPFEYRFLDEEFDKLYSTEKRTGRIASTFALLAILIACLGLFGLATFTAQQRTKEIGIRKTLGASVANVTALLTTDFIKLVLVAIVLATPVAWYIGRAWLSDFAYRIDLSWWIFALAALAALVIAGLTVSYQSVKAALTDPVKSLRSE